MTKVTKTYKIKSVITPPPPPPPPPIFPPPPPPPPSSGIIKIATVGDWSSGNSPDGPDVFSTAAAIRAKMPDAHRLLLLGDYSYTTNGNTGVDYWWNNVVGSQLNAKATGVLGNHETGAAQGEARYAQLLKIPNTGSYWQFTEKIGNVGIVYINTEQWHPSGSGQLRFIKDRLDLLQGDPGIDWIIAAMHKPMYTYCWFRYAEVSNNTLHPLFDQYSKLKLVLSGHMHGYSRSYPIKWGIGQRVGNPCHPEFSPSTYYWVPQVTDRALRPNYHNPVGQIYIMAGMAGRGFYDWNTLCPEKSPNPCPIDFIPVKYAGNSAMYGFLGIESQGKKLTVTFHANKSIPPPDSFSITRS